MSKKSKNFLLLILAISTIFPKWFLSVMYFDNSTIVNTIFNVKDIQYFPIIISISDSILNPSYLEYYTENRLISFPIYGLLLHIFFYKIFGIFSIIVLEFILHLIFLVIFFKAINKIFNDFKNTLLFCFLIYFLISFLNIILFDENIKYLKLFYESLEQNFTTRLPRPLFTGIIYFYFFFLLYEFKNKLKKIELKYFIIIFFLLSVFLNSFFYYFLNFSLLIFLLLIKFLRKNLLKFLYENRSKILILISFFLISSVPFLIQIYFGENDYSQRIGVFEITLEKKIYLLKYYFLNLFKKEFFILILLSFIIHLYLIKNSFNIKS